MEFMGERKIIPIFASRNMHKCRKIFTVFSNAEGISPLYIHVKYAMIPNDGAVS